MKRTRNSKVMSKKEKRKKDCFSVGNILTIFPIISPKSLFAAQSQREKLAQDINYPKHMS